MRRQPAVLRDADSPCPAPRRLHISSGQHKRQLTDDSSSQHWVGWRPLGMVIPLSGIFKVQL